MEDLAKAMTVDERWDPIRSHSTPPSLPPVQKDLYASKRTTASKPSTAGIFATHAATPSSAAAARPPRRPVPGSSADAQAKAEASAKAAQAAARAREEYRTPEEMLFYSKKPRDVDFEPKTAPLHRGSYQVLGSLGPDLQSDAVLEKVCVVC